MEHRKPSVDIRSSLFTHIEYWNEGLSAQNERVCERFAPVELTSYDASTGTAGYLELNFTEALKSYKAENVQMAPDIAGIQILAYGVELDPSTAKGTVTASAQLPLTFNLNLKLSNSMKLSGSVGYNISLFASVDYGFFKINSFSYGSKTSSFQNINLSKSGKFFEKEAPAKSLKLARVPMVSATLLSVWLELTLVVSAQGEISIKSELTTTEKCTWKNKQMTKSKSESNKKFDISAAASISATVQGSIIVRIGFVAAKTHVEVAALSVSYGWSATVKTSTESLGCADVIISSNPERQPTHRSAKGRNDWKERNEARNKLIFRWRPVQCK